MRPVTWYFNCNKKPDSTMRKFKTQYCVRGDVHKRLSPEPLKFYFPVVQWYTVRLMFILKFILGLHIQSIDLSNVFAQVDIPGGDPVFIELHRNYNSDGEQCDVVLRLNKNLYGQAKDTHLWYEKMQHFGWIPACSCLKL